MCDITRQVCFMGSENVTMRLESNDISQSIHCNGRSKDERVGNAKFTMVLGLGEAPGRGATEPAGNRQKF
jgi:hypothetical protein